MRNCDPLHDFDGAMQVLHSDHDVAGSFEESTVGSKCWVSDDSATSKISSVNTVLQGWFSVVVSAPAVVVRGLHGGSSVVVVGVMGLHSGCSVVVVVAAAVV